MTNPERASFIAFALLTQLKCGSSRGYNPIHSEEGLKLETSLFQSFYDD